MAKKPTNGRINNGYTPQPPYPKRSAASSGNGSAKPSSSARTPGDSYTSMGEGDAGARQAPSIESYKTYEKLYAEAKRGRDPWIQLWQEIYNYTLPQREHFFQKTPGQQRTDLIFDETAVTGVPRFASRLMSGYFPQYGEIFSLEYGLDAPAHMQTGTGFAKLEELTRMIHTSWQNSNFASEISEAMIDLGIGTSNVCLEPGDWPGDVVFTAMPMTHIAIIKGRDDTIRGWFTWCQMALDDILKKWPKGTYDAQFRNRLKANSRDKDTVVNAVWENDGAVERTWTRIVVVESAKKAIWEQQLKGEGACPWSTARWSKTGMDAWGRGPLQLVMPAIKTANLTVQLVLENAELALGGVYVYDDDGVFNPDNIILQPGTFIPKSVGSQVAPLGSAAKFDVSQLVLQDMRMNIKKGLFIDEMDTPGKTPRSAYEIQSRIAETARDLSAPGARITKEHLVEWVNRTIYIFEKQGILNARNMRVDGKRIRLNVKSPFLRGQDAIMMQEMMTMAGQLNAIFGAGTSAMQFKRSTTVPEMARRNGVSLSMLNTDAEIKQMMAEAQAGQVKAGQLSGQPGAGAGVSPGTPSDPAAMLDSLAKLASAPN
jgi:hypothetical protein